MSSCIKDSGWRGVDEVGNKYGKLTVKECAGTKGASGEFYWLCECECGVEKEVRGSHLRRGNVKSCGCLLVTSPSNHHDYTGEIVKSWTVLSKIGKARNSQFIYLCRCECGKEKTLTSTGLKTGQGHCGCKSDQGKNSHKNLVYNNYKNGAKRRGFLFELSKDDVWNMSQLDCYYCGAPPRMRVLSYKSNPKSRRMYSANGIDRLNNSVGYIHANCVPCCQSCNLAKMKMLPDEFINLARRISKKWFGR